MKKVLAPAELIKLNAFKINTATKDTRPFITFNFKQDALELIARKCLMDFNSTAILYSQATLTLDISSDAPVSFDVNTHEFFKHFKRFQKTKPLALSYENNTITLEQEGKVIAFDALIRTPQADLVIASGGTLSYHQLATAYKNKITLNSQEFIDAVKAVKPLMAKGKTRRPYLKYITLKVHNDALEVRACDGYSLAKVFLNAQGAVETNLAFAPSQLLSLINPNEPLVLEHDGKEDLKLSQSHLTIQLSGGKTIKSKYSLDYEHKPVLLDTTIKAKALEKLSTKFSIRDDVFQQVYKFMHKEEELKVTAYDLKSVAFIDFASKAKEILIIGGIRQ